MPEEFALVVNYPNPFNPVMTINYALPVDAGANLCIYNLYGQKVATLIDNHQRAGYKSISWDASNFSSGIYFYRLVSEERAITKTDDIA